MTDTASPFRRFPWVQLVFCIACLAMTAWTWMRYSYCWGLTLAQVNGRENRQLGIWPEGAYASLMGTPITVHAVEMPEWSKLAWDDLEASEVAVAVRGTGSAPCAGEGLLCEYRGRLYAAWGEERIPTVSGDRPDVFLGIDLRQGRFHPASIAGLVVGAMGCFIFGLYLRRWLRERRAA